MNLQRALSLSLNDRSINAQVPIRWPKSRDEVWQSNVPHTFLATEKSDQHWMVVVGQKVNFPGGGTHFPNGADKYISSLAKVRLYPAVFVEYARCHITNPIIFVSFPDCGRKK